MRLLFAVPPERPVIFDEKRGDRTKLLEPYDEGSDVVLVCEVTGGKFTFVSVLLRTVIAVLTK